MRFAGRFVSFFFVLLRWHCVRRQSSRQPTRLRQGLTMAQGGMLMRGTPVITTPRDTTVIVITGISRAHRAGIPAWRKCRRGALPAPMPASPRAPPPAAWRWRAGSVHLMSSLRRAGGNPTGRGSLWCARFMNMVLQRSGHYGTGSDMANSFASYGQRVSGPQIGAIAVMGRRGGGHVGIVSGIDAGGNPIMVSGNNRNRVVEAPISRGRIYAYVMPTG
jgi:uncharacterized protein (TIGR02594 family)